MFVYRIHIMTDKQLTPVKKKRRTAAQTRMINQTVNAVLITDTIDQAAKLLRITRPTVYDRMKRFPEIKEKLATDIQINPEVARIKIQEKTLKAVERIDSLMDSHRDDIKLKASQDILNRANVGNTSEKSVQVNILNQIKADRQTYNI